MKTEEELKQRLEYTDKKIVQAEKEKDFNAYRYYISLHYWLKWVLEE